MAERLEKEREQVKERVSHHTMSRTSSGAASHRGESRAGHNSATPTSPRAEPRAINPTPSVRPTFSFAHAAAGKKDAVPEEAEVKDAAEQELADKVAEVQI